jgi:single-stranded-DNA-specific exonuclease
MSHSPLSFTGRLWNIHSRTASHDFSDLLAKERRIQKGTLSEQIRLSDAMLFAEMGRAVGRIQEAVSRKERVGIFGDYDADGITGAVQLTRAFRRRGIDPLVYLPHREREGYGLKQESIDSIARHNITLLITVDTGINAHEEIEYASSKGMNVIVTDHHVVTHGRPPAYAVLHPLVPSSFPNELSSNRNS